MFFNMKKTKAIAFSGITAALSVVIMLIGGLIGIGAYAAPMISGIILIPAGKKYGKKYHISLWIAVSILSFLIVPDIEEVFLFVFLFGLYPLIRNMFMRLPKFIRFIAKLLYFNTVVITLEWLIIKFFVPEAMSVTLAVTLILMGNFTFVMYDYIIPRAELILYKYFGKVFKN